MNVSGTRSFAARRELVWQVLNDPEAMARLMPGVERFDVRDDRHWVAQVKIPLGLGGLRMSINFDKLEEREPEFARLHAKGTGVGALMDMNTQFHLDDVDGGTNMRWQADVRIAGPVGSMGQRVLQPIVNQQVSQVLDALDRQVQEASAAEGSPADVPPPAVTAGSATVEAAASPSGSEPSTGSAGTLAPTTAIDPPATDPDLKDAGPPAPVSASADPTSGHAAAPSTGDAAPPPAETSRESPSAGETEVRGAEEGLNPWSPESYDDDPQGPTISTEDRP